MSGQQFAIILSGDRDPISVLLTEEPMLFGRSSVYVDVPLRDAKVAKVLFRIQWNAERLRHEIQVMGAFFPPSLNDSELGSEECRLLSPGDIIGIGPFKMEYIEVSAASLHPAVPDGSIEISRTLANEAQGVCQGCEACDSRAAVPFYSVLDYLTHRNAATEKYVLRIPLHCLNCGRSMTENTRVAVRTHIGYDFIAPGSAFR